MVINYIKGDATNPQAEGIKIICHVCNNVGGWGKGFVLAISNKWSSPESDYRKWHSEKSKNDFGLGSVQFIQVEEFIYIANMIGQNGIKAGNDGPPIRYQTIEDCLFKVAKKANELSASVHMPRIGCGLAGGKWQDIEPIIIKTLCQNNIPVTVYDF